jgi:ubiquitin-protein ligase
MLRKPKTTMDSIKEAYEQAQNAVAIFDSTLNELKSANEKLNIVIDSETEAIKNKQDYIRIASQHISNNTAIITKLQGLLNS